MPPRKQRKAKKAPAQPAQQLAEPAAVPEPAAADAAAAAAAVLTQGPDDTQEAPLLPDAERKKKPKDPKQWREETDRKFETLSGKIDGLVDLVYAVIPRDDARPPLPPPPPPPVVDRQPAPALPQPPLLCNIVPPVDVLPPCPVPQQLPYSLPPPVGSRPLPPDAHLARADAAVYMPPPSHPPVDGEEVA